MGIVAGTRHRAFVIVAVATVQAFYVFAPTARADDYWWNVAGATSASWGTPASWSTDLAGTITAVDTPNADDLLRIASTAANNVPGAYTISLDANQSVLGIIHNKGNFTFTPGSVTNPTLMIGASGITSANSSGPRIGTTAAPIGILLNGNQTWSHSQSGANNSGLTIGGTVSGMAATSTTQTLKIAGATNAFTFAIFEGLVQDQAAGALTTGKLAISVEPTSLPAITDDRKRAVQFNNALNTFSGGITVKSGANLAIGGGAAAATGTVTPFGTGDITIEDGGGMYVGFGGNASTRTIPNNFFVAGRGLTGFGVIRSGLNLSNFTIFSGNITLTGDARISPTQNTGSGAPSTTFSGVISGNHNLELGYRTDVTTVNLGILTNTGNSWSGTTTIVGGQRIQLGIAGGTTGEFIPNTSVVSFDNAAGSIDFGGAKTETVAGLNNAGAFGIVQNLRNATTGTLVLSTPNASNYTFGGVIRNNAGVAGQLGTVALTKSGSGIQSLTGTNTYTGATTVDGGTLVVGVGGIGSLGATAVAVNNTGTLGGSGTIGETVTVNTGGTVAPGNSVGTLTAAAASLTTGSKFAFEFNGTANDLFAVTNALSIIDGSVYLYNEGTSNPMLTGGTYKLFKYGTLAGSEDSLTIGNPVPSYSYTFDTVTDGGGNFVTLTVAVPEPTSFGAASMCAALGLLVRRQRVA